MLYSKFIEKVKDITITYDEDAMVYYLEPDWQTIIYEHGLQDFEAVTDMHIEGWYDLEDVLKLEVEKRNAITSRKNVVFNWLYEIISTNADPGLTDAENNIFAALMDKNKKESEPQNEEKPEE